MPYLLRIKTFIEKHELYLKSILIDYKPYLNSLLTNSKLHLNSFADDYNPYDTSLLAISHYDHRIIPTLRLTSLLAASILTIILFHNNCWPVTSLLVSAISGFYIHHRYIGRYLYYSEKSTQEIAIAFEVVEAWIINAPIIILWFYRWLTGKERRNRRRVPTGPRGRNHLL